MEKSSQTSKLFRNVIVTLLLIVLAIIGLNSCASYCHPKIVELNNVTHDTIVYYVSKTDSVHVRDSVYEFVKEKGDTVIQYKYVLKTKYVDRPTKEYIYVNKTDTISVPVPVERKLGCWERTKVKYGGYALGIGFAFVIVLFGSCIYRVNRK